MLCNALVNASPVALEDDRRFKSARSTPSCAVSFRFQPVPLDESTRPANANLPTRAARFTFFFSRHRILRSVRNRPELLTSA